LGAPPFGARGFSGFCRGKGNPEPPMGLGEKLWHQGAGEEVIGLGTLAPLAQGGGAHPKVGLGP